jgi:hypothetical protein
MKELRRNPDFWGLDKNFLKARRGRINAEDAEVYSKAGPPLSVLYVG